MPWAQCMPAGMMALGGVGNGVLEISEDLVGFQYLAYMQVDDPDLFAALYRKIGDLMVDLWTTFLERYGEYFAICRFGDDLGFKTSTLVSRRRSVSTSFPSIARDRPDPERRQARSCGTLVARSSRSWTT